MRGLVSNTTASCFVHETKRLLEIGGVEDVGEYMAGVRVEAAKHSLSKLIALGDISRKAKLQRT